MKYIFILLIAIPIIYLTIAHTLALFPEIKIDTTGSLDFDQLDTADLNAVESTDSSFTARDGNQLFYRSIEGNADIVIVLLHGSGTEGRYLMPLAQRLHSALNASIVVPDLRGHGESSLSNIGDIDYLGQFEHDLEDLHENLKTKYPEANHYLGGHSSGGGLALKYGALKTAAFDGYILLAPYLGYDAPTIRENSGGWVQVNTRRYIGIIMLNKVGITYLNNRPVLYFNRPKNIDDDLQADHYTYRLNESFSPAPYQDTLEKNQKSILALIGEHDEAFYANKFEAVFKEHSPVADVRVIPGLKHLNIQNDRDVAESISTWIRKTSG